MSGMQYFTDEHIPKDAVIEIRKNNITVVRCEDVDMKSATDEELLIYATNHNYTLVSMDDDVTRLHSDWLEQGRVHAGILYAPMAKYQGVSGIGAIVTWCVDMATLIEQGVGTLEDDVENELFCL